MTDLSAAEHWFVSRGWQPLDFQREVWRAYLRGESGLVHAATGTGKTLAAWWGPLLEWLAEQQRAGSSARAGGRVKRSVTPPLRVLWITPLRALAAATGFLSRRSRPLRGRPARQAQPHQARPRAAR